MKKDEIKRNKEFELFKKGFNYGYDVLQKDPEALKIIASLDKNSPFIKGVNAGKDEFEFQDKSKEIEKHPNWMDKGRLEKVFSERSHSHDIPKGRDKVKDKGEDKEP